MILKDVVHFLLTEKSISLWDAIHGYTNIFLPPASAIEVIKTEPSACVCVSVSTLMAEPFGVRP